MNNFQKLQSLTLDELAKWIDKYGKYDSSPWAQSFANIYCADCEPIKMKYLDGLRKCNVFLCEVGECKYGFNNLPSEEIVRMWLREEINEV